MIPDSNWEHQGRSKNFDTACGSLLGREPTETALRDINLNVTGYEEQEHLFLPVYMPPPVPPSLIKLSVNFTVRSLTKTLKHSKDGCLHFFYKKM